MKTLKIFIVMLTLGAGVAKAQFTTAELQVSGLTCSMCSKATEKALNTLPFIGNIKTDLNRNVFIITFKSNMPVSMAQISKKVQDAGFSVNNLKAVFNFSGTKLANNLFSYLGESYLLTNTTAKPLAGPVTLTFVDKGFAPPSVYKKYAAKSPEGAVKTSRFYRVVI